MITLQAIKMEASNFQLAFVEESIATLSILSLLQRLIACLMPLSQYHDKQTSLL